MNLTREQMLAEMGIKPVWRLRQSTPSEAGQLVAEASESGSPVPAASFSASTVSLPADDIGALDWDALEQRMAACHACELHKTRRKVVPGVGDRAADWLFIGEGPGAEEDAQGEPFVGQAGKLLDNMLAAIGLRRGEGVYIANTVKCRPPGNRTPESAEMAACHPYLARQIALIRPKIIVLLGRAAVHSVLGIDHSLAGLRGTVHTYQGIPVVVTYHPAYLLRNLPEKAKSWEDLLFARRQLRLAPQPELPV